MQSLNFFAVTGRFQHVAAALLRIMTPSSGLRGLWTDSEIALFVCERHREYFAFRGGADSLLRSQKGGGDLSEKSQMLTLINFSDHLPMLGCAKWPGMAGNRE